MAWVGAFRCIDFGIRFHFFLCCPFYGNFAVSWSWTGTIIIISSSSLSTAVIMVKLMPAWPSSGRPNLQKIFNPHARRLISSFHFMRLRAAIALTLSLSYWLVHHRIARRPFSCRHVACMSNIVHTLFSIILRRLTRTPFVAIARRFCDWLLASDKALKRISGKMPSSNDTDDILLIENVLPFFLFLMFKCLYFIVSCSGIVFFFFLICFDSVFVSFRRLTSHALAHMLRDERMKISYENAKYRAARDSSVFMLKEMKKLVR